MNDSVAVATFILAAGTFLLALFTHRMAAETRNVATRTEDLAKAAHDQVSAALDQVSLTRDLVSVAKDDLARARAEAIASQEPHVVLELEEGQTIGPVRQREGMNLFFLWVDARLVNYGGHAIVDQLRVTGSPQVETRPLDVAGFLPAGGRLPFKVRFDLGNGLGDPAANASVPIRARAVQLSEWHDSLYFITARLLAGAGEHLAGWHAEVSQPLNIIEPRSSAS